MKAGDKRWPRVRSLGVLLQSPAHRVVRVLHVTQSHWQLPERRGRRGGVAPVTAASPASAPSQLLLAGAGARAAA